MSNDQIAHDLAVSKLYGSDCSIEELCKKYNQYYEEILDYLRSKPYEPVEATVIGSRIL